MTPLFDQRLPQGADRAAHDERLDGLDIVRLDKPGVAEGISHVVETVIEASKRLYAFKNDLARRCYYQAGHRRRTRRAACTPP